MARAAKDSSATPQPVLGLARPASVYITVSRSGQTRRPHRSKSSAVLTMTARSPGLPFLARAASRPDASFAPPTPPARATTLRFLSGGFMRSSWYLGTVSGSTNSDCMYKPRYQVPACLQAPNRVRAHLHQQHSVSDRTESGWSPSTSATFHPILVCRFCWSLSGRAGRRAPYGSVARLTPLLLGQR